MSAFNFVDLAFLFFTFIFVLTAVFRGLIKEVFAFANWIISFILSYLLAPYLGEFMKSYVKTKIIADLSARGIIFLVVFLTIALSTSGLVKSLREATPKTIDRVLGAVFAVFKTLIIFGCVYSIYANMYGFLLGNKLNSKENIEHPKVFLEAKSFHMIQSWGEFVDPAVKLFFDAIAKNIEFAIVKSMSFEDKINQAIQDKSLDPDKVDDVINQVGNPEDLSKLKDQIESGYQPKDIDKINNLIENIDKK